MPGNWFWRSKPPVGTPLDPGDPLTRGLVYFPLIGNDGTSYNILRPSEVLVPSSTASRAATPAGTAIVTTGSVGSEAVVYSPAMDYAVRANRWSYLVALQNTSPTQASTYAANWQHDNNAGGENCALIYGFTANSYEFYGAGGARFVIKNIGTTDKLLHWIGIVSDPAAATVTGYFDGLQSGTLTSYGGTSQINFWHYIGNYFASGANPFAGRWAYEAFWNRAISASEMAQVVASPWRFFASPVWRRYFIPAITTTVPKSMFVSQAVNRASTY